MRVKLKSSGGIAAPLVLPALVLDAADLESGEAAALHSLVEAARARAATAARAPLPDETSYSISVDDEGHSYEIAARDSTMTPQMRELVDFIGRRAKR